MNIIPDEVVRAVRDRFNGRVAWGVVLGSGLGGLADRVEGAVAIPYAELPGFPRSTAVGHAGRLVLGELFGQPACVLQGRFHLYEGWSPQQAALPVRLMWALGARSMVVTNAAGGLNPSYRVGDLMRIDDHINLMFKNPLVGPNDDSLGPRFPDMSAPYDAGLGETAERAARDAGVPLWRGVYVGMTGPTYETRAEIRTLRRLGGDAVGMSTVPEVIAARHLGVRVLGLSVITNVCSPDVQVQASGHAVVEAAGAAADRLTRLVEGVLRV